MVSPRTVTPATTPWMVLCWPDDWLPSFDLSLSDWADVHGAMNSPKLNTIIAAVFMIPLLADQVSITDVIPIGVERGAGIRGGPASHEFSPIGPQGNYREVDHADRSAKWEKRRRNSPRP